MSLEDLVRERVGELGLNDSITPHVLEELKRIHEAKALGTKRTKPDVSKLSQVLGVQGTPRFASSLRAHARQAGKQIDKNVEGLFDHFWKLYLQYKPKAKLPEPPKGPDDTFPKKKPKPVVKGGITLSKFKNLSRIALKAQTEEAFKLGVKSAGMVGPTGGLRALTPDEKKWLNSYLREELKHFEKFISSVAKGQSDKRTKQRLKMYATTIKSAYQSGRILSVGTDVEIHWVLESVSPCPDCKLLHRYSPFTVDTLPTVPKGGQTRCFTFSKTKVITDHGWEQIRNVNIGDFVLTGKGRFRKVISRFHDHDIRTLEPIYKITYTVPTYGARSSRYKGHGYRSHSVKVTGDHLFYLNGSEIKASDIREGDSLDVVGGTCSHCKGIIDFGDLRKLNNTYCSVSCASKAESHLRLEAAHEATRNLVAEGIHSFQICADERYDKSDVEVLGEDKARNKASKLRAHREGKTYEDIYGDRAGEIKKKVADRDYKFLGSLGLHNFQDTKGLSWEEAYGHARAEELKAKLREGQARRSKESKRKTSIASIRSQRDKGRLFFSKPERIVRDLLDDMNIEYIHQWEHDLGFVDFFLVDYDIIIEVDGNYWHNYPNGTPKDKETTEWLEALDYRVLRFWESNILSDIDSVEETISLHMDNHEGNFVTHNASVSSVDIINYKTPRKLYCLEVDEDHSFVTYGGLVSHNCLSHCYCSLRIEKVTPEAVAKLRKKRKSASWHLNRLKANRKKR